MKLKITETTDTSISFYIEKDGEIFFEETLTAEELKRYLYLKNIIKKLNFEEIRKGLEEK